MDLCQKHHEELVRELDQRGLGGDMLSAEDRAKPVRWLDEVAELEEKHGDRITEIEPRLALLATNLVLNVASVPPVKWWLVVENKLGGNSCPVCVQIAMCQCGKGDGCGSHTIVRDTVRLMADEVYGEAAAAEVES